MLSLPPFESSAYFFDLFSLSFLTLPCYYALSSQRARRVLLTATGLYLLYFIAPRLLVFYIPFWSAVFFAHRTAFRERRTPAAKALAAAEYLGIAAVILPMLAWKIMGNDFVALFSDKTNQALSVLSTRLWEIDMIRRLVTPVGLSFATFRAGDLLIKTYLGKISGLSFDQVMFYGFFPPVQVIGPIIEYEEVADQGQKPSPARITDGLLRLCLGAVKVFALAAPLSQFEGIFQHFHGVPFWTLWLKLAGYSWYFYLNFAGYSDMAIGGAALYGFELKENFNFPFLRSNIQEFWGSWHMGLTRWAQRNIFVPAGGYRARTQYVALFLTMMTIALWHNLSASMCVFGVYHFALLALYRSRLAGAKAPGMINAKAPGIISAKAPGMINAKTAPWREAGGVLLTYAAVLVSFPLLVLNISEAVDFYAALAGR